MGPDAAKPHSPPHPEFSATRSARSNSGFTGGAGEIHIQFCRRKAVAEDVSALPDGPIVVLVATLEIGIARLLSGCLCGVAVGYGILLDVLCGIDALLVAVATWIPCFPQCFWIEVVVRIFHAGVVACCDALHATVVLRLARFLSGGRNRATEQRNGESGNSKDRRR